MYMKKNDWLNILIGWKIILWEDTTSQGYTVYLSG